MDKTAIWNELCETDPNFTRPFDRGGFSGTDINPTWRWRKLTETFGPVGIGWGTSDPEWRISPVGQEEVMVTVMVRGWYKTSLSDEAVSYTPPGFGCDYMLRSTRNGLKSDDEAAKKAMTDAIGKAFSFLGLCADVHLKQYDDSKYVEALREKYSQQSPDTTPATKPTTPKPTTLSESIRMAIMMAESFEDLMEVVETNAKAHKEVDKEVVKYAVTDWTMGKLANVKTLRGLNTTWGKISSGVNGIKNTHPTVHEAIKAGFSKKKEEIQ